MYFLSSIVSEVTEEMYKMSLKEGDFHNDGDRFRKVPCKAERRNSRDDMSEVWDEFTAIFNDLLHEGKADDKLQRDWNQEIINFCYPCKFPPV
jgi:hypothetical protein